MTKRPHSVTIISGLFVVTGIVGLAYHATEFRPAPSFQSELVWVCFVRFLAIICGVFMFRGNNWARWGTIGWLAYHVILSTFHSLAELAMHGVMLAVIAYFLLRPGVSAYFNGARAKPAQMPETNDKPAA